MKNKFYALLLAFSTFLTVTTSAQVFQEKTFMLNAGVGFWGSSNFAATYSITGLSSWPAFSVSGEYAAIPTGDIGMVSFGGILGFWHASANNTSTTEEYCHRIHDYESVTTKSSISITGVIFQARAAWHYLAPSDQWDVYAGFGFGITRMSLLSKSETTHSVCTEENDIYNWPLAATSPSSSFFVGGRMMFKENIGMFAEVGYSDFDSIRLGLTFKL